MTTAAKLTKSVVDRIPLCATGKQAYYYDTELSGFGLRVGATSKAYFAEWKVRGKTCRKTIGRHGPFAPERARREALQLIADMQRGVNPIEEDRKRKAQGVTLEKAFEAFMDARKSLKPHTKRDYEYCMSRYFSGWKHTSLTSITREKVARRHADLGAVSPAQANLAMRFLRALFNFAITKYEPHIIDNPVKHLSAARAWYRVERRQTYIKRDQLKAWFQAVLAMKGDRDPSMRGNQDVVADYLVFVLLTGLRREEAASLAWENVDLKGKTFTVIDTKNREDHTLPLSTYLQDMLKRRADDREDEEPSPYVFPGRAGEGKLIEPRRLILRICEASGVQFRVHDLRRTFATVAESLDIPAYALKRLLNHKMSNDVTAGYIVTDVERLREPMQKITDFVLSCAGLRSSPRVVALKARSRAA